MVKIVKNSVGEREQLHLLNPPNNKFTHPAIHTLLYYSNPGYTKLSKPPKFLKWRIPRPVDVLVYKYSDPCNDSYQASIRIIHWRIPNIEILHRAKNCRLKKESPTEGEDSPIQTYNIDCQAPPKCEEEGERAIYIWWLNSRIEYNDKIAFDREHILFWEMFSSSSTIDKVTFPKDKFNKFGREVYAEIEYTIIYKYISNYDHNKGFQVEEKTRTLEFKEKLTFFRRDGVANLAATHTTPIASAGRVYVSHDYFASGESFRFRTSWRKSRNLGSDALARKSVAFNGTREGISGSNSTPYRSGESYPVDSYYDYFGTKVVKFETNLTHELVIDEQTYTGLTYCENGDVFVSECSPNTPKPPPPPKKMRCCPDNSALLQQILKVVKQNKKVLGFDDYPVSVPESFVSVDGKEKANKNVESITQFFAWYIERFDEIVGEFEIPIEVEDIDLLKDGNQTVKFKLPNIAEAIAELFLMMINISINNETQLNIAIRTLTEAGADKQQNFKSAMMLDAIIEYLGFSYKDVAQKLPLTFTPGKEVLIEILKETEVDVSTIEYDDNMNLQRALFELLQSAAIIRTKHWKQIDPKKDIKGQVLSTLLQNKDLISKFIKGLNLEELEDEINKINVEQNTP